jgi:hypothetical protein
LAPSPFVSLGHIAAQNFPVPVFGLPSAHISSS